MASLDEWCARFAALSQPCMQGGPVPGLTCAEKVPSAPDWPPMGLPWMNQLDGLGPSLGTNPFQPVVAPAPVDEPSPTNPRLKAVRGCRWAKAHARRSRAARAACRRWTSSTGASDALERMLHATSPRTEDRRTLRRRERAAPAECAGLETRRDAPYAGPQQRPYLWRQRGRGGGRRRADAVPRPGRARAVAKKNHEARTHAFLSEVTICQPHDAGGRYKAPARRKGC